MVTLQIRATDIDAIPNGHTVTYDCCHPTNDSGSLFAVDQLGQIVVAAGVTLRGHTGVYSLTITAKDGGSPERSGEAVVLVRVDDYNDHPPELRVLNDRGTTIHRPEVRYTTLTFITSIYSLIHGEEAIAQIKV